jgi:hypothetical protein
MKAKQNNICFSQAFILWNLTLNNFYNYYVL